jgi:hypothetical protein
MKSLQNRWRRTGHRPVLALRRRPSPAMIIALIALFVSLSGVSYGVATGFIDSREIKNNEVRSLDIRNNEVRTRDLRNNEVRGIDIRNSTVQSRDIAINAVQGEDVKEDTLAKVPSALLADSATTATSAGSADSVDGLSFRKFAYAGEIGSDFVEVVNFGGLRLEARCENAGVPALFVRANPAVANSEISTRFGPTAAPFENNDEDFDPGDNFVVVDHAEGVGQTVFAAAEGGVVTIDALAREDANGVLGTTNDCGFFGVAQAG